MKTIQKRRSRTLAVGLVGLLALTALQAGACWFKKGQAGYVCKSSADCNEGLRCRTYMGRGKVRKQCRPRSARSISSKSGYTDFAIYLSYAFWISLPFVLAGLAIKHFVIDKKQGGSRPTQGGPSQGGPSQGNQPPPPPPPSPTA